MNDIIELLLKRMDTHPEEFCDGWAGESDYTVGREVPKWHRFIYQLRERMGYGDAKLRGNTVVPLPFLSDEEVEHLYAKYVETQGKEFEKYVLRTLLAPNTPVLGLDVPEDTFSELEV